MPADQLPEIETEKWQYKKRFDYNDLRRSLLQHFNWCNFITIFAYSNNALAQEGTHETYQSLQN